MENPAKKIALAASELLLLALMTLVPPMLIFLDLAVLQNGVSEGSATEITQATLLLGSALAFFYGARRYPQSRGFLVLVASFFGCMFIRELEGLLDYLVWSGFWFWPAILLAISAIGYSVICCRDTILGSMSEFVDTKPYFHIMFGLIAVLVFSRVFGSGTLLWKHVLDDEYTHDFKTAVQEGLELFGYLFIAYGSFLFFREKRNRA